ncbi:hypothetical protein G4X40_11020 [Rhodococcus sp. D2-41]|uniref:Mce-associated membrane protein n=1 Tax=Speluncibacter jeojiensis TaxID=2710754 RepID=A0A9X4M2I5_9ACTN|nr:hypothetical protein [Rhodococcus sp. D2-41]MDG3010680.1 hypothetical protein [Rhodococcus sp. D2-41]MDG3016860.1 hypothetical protein [Corynebacteriales bacterium D3-21]
MTARLVPTPQRIGGLLVVCLAVGLVTASALLWQARGHAAAAQEARSDAVAAATTVVEQMLTYSGQTVDHDLAAAQAGLAGSFASRYKTLADRTIAPAAKAQGIDTKATVAHAGVISADTDHAQVLLFVDQLTTTAAQPAPTVADSRVRVSLIRDGNRWKVTGFDPL